MAQLPPLPPISQHGFLASLPPLPPSTTTTASTSTNTAASYAFDSHAVSATQYGFPLNTSAGTSANMFATGSPASAGGLGMYGSSSVLTDADLDFENILASLGGGTTATSDQPGLLDSLHHQQQQKHLHQQPAAGHHRQSPLAPVEENENGNGQEQHATAEYFTHPPKPLRRSSTQDYGTPTSYGASPSETFTTPSTSSKRSVSQERIGRAARSSSASGVGKAPRQTSRSRSARRTSSVATAGYQDRSDAKDRGRDRSRQRGGGGDDHASPASNMGTPAAATTASTPGASGTAHMGGGAGGPGPSASMPPPLPPHLAYAMPFPHPSTYGAHPASLPAHAGGWFPPTSAMHHPAALAGAYPGPHFIPPPMAHPALSFDPLTGWRPTVGPMPSSAPPATDSVAKGKVPPAKPVATTAAIAAPPSSSSSSKKNKGLEDVQEEANEPEGKNEHLTDKRRKRRESHNAVERRRRDNINDRIAELASLLPEAFQAGGPSSKDKDFDGMAGPASPAIGSLSLMSPGPSSGVALGGSPTSFHSASGGGYMAAAASQRATAGMSAQAQAAAQKPNKGAVLAKSVDYIRYLQQVVELQQQQAAELQRQNAELRRAVEASPSPPSSHSHYLPPQPPCFPPHVPSAGGSTSTSASVSRQAASPVGTRPLGSSGLGLSIAGGDSNGSGSAPSSRGGRRDSNARDSLGGDMYGHDERAGGGDDYSDEDDDGERFTPECEGPDGIDTEKGWEAMLQAGGMHVLKMEEDD